MTVNDALLRNYRPPKVSFSAGAKVPDDVIHLCSVYTGKNLAALSKRQKSLHEAQQQRVWRELQQVKSLRLLFPGIMNSEKPKLNLLNEKIFKLFARLQGGTEAYQAIDRGYVGKDKTLYVERFRVLGAVLANRVMQAEAPRGDSFPVVSKRGLHVLKALGVVFLALIVFICIIGFYFALGTVCGALLLLWLYHRYCVYETRMKEDYPVVQVFQKQVRAG
jgi:hypothetical protein